jgi:hypothetical protein
MRAKVMPLEEVLRLADDLGLGLEKHETGYRMYCSDGRVAGDLLTHEQVEVFLLRRLDEQLREHHRAVADTGCAFPSS